MPNTKIVLRVEDGCLVEETRTPLEVVESWISSKDPRFGVDTMKAGSRWYVSTRFYAADHARCASLANCGMHCPIDRSLPAEYRHMNMARTKIEARQLSKNLRSLYE